jgi:thioredoxin-like negative regulator of GroEL/predicted regulator of Ras-like GTPase activity (Roadblock/LC7/MglB family)
MRLTGATAVEKEDSDVGFYTRMNQKRKLKRLKAALAEKPSPATASGLIDTYLETNQNENAYSIARQGVEIYPRSHTMSQVFQRLNKSKYADEIRSLQQEIRSRPNPITYARLADLFYSIGETDLALSTCRESVEAFPDYEGTFLILGKIRYQRWREDGLASDGLIAVQNFEKALELNPGNFKTLLQLAEIYLQVGVISRAKQLIQVLHVSAGDNERVAQLAEHIKNLPGVMEIEIEEAFKAAEEKWSDGVAPGANDDPDAWIVKRFSADMREIDEMAKFFFSLDGFFACCVFRRDGSLISCQKNWDVEQNLLADSLRKVMISAQNSSLKMDIGSVQDAVIETSVFRVHIFAFGGLSFIIMMTPDSKQQVAESAIGDFIDNHLYLFAD